MMSEEEKKAIELLKQEPDYSLNYYNRENAIDIVLKLIEKQQKEIEELKKDNNHQWEERCRLTFDIKKDIELLQELLKEE